MIYIAIAIAIADAVLLGFLWYHYPPISTRSGHNPDTHRPGLHLSEDGTPLTVCRVCESAWPCDKA